MKIKVRPDRYGNYLIVPQDEDFLRKLSEDAVAAGLSYYYPRDYYAQDQSDREYVEAIFGDDDREALHAGWELEADIDPWEYRQMVGHGL